MTNAEVRSRIAGSRITVKKWEQMVWPYLKVLWHGEDNSAGTVKGTGRIGRQKNRCEDNIKEWSGMEFGDSLRVLEDREIWTGIVATSSVVTRRPSRLRD